MRRQADRRRRARGEGRSARRPRTFARIRRNLPSGDPFQHWGYGKTLQSGGVPFAFFSTSSTIRRVFNSRADRSASVLSTASIGGAHEPRPSVPERAAPLPHGLAGRHRSSTTSTTRSWPRTTSRSGHDAARSPRATSTPSAVHRPHWVRSSPYTTAGSFISRVFDASVEVDWQSIAWDAATPDETSFAMRPTGGTPVPITRVARSSRSRRRARSACTRAIPINR